MTTCKECNKEISSTAENCPNCGAKPYQFKFGFVGFIITLIIILGIKSCIFGDEKPKQEVKYDPLDYAAGMCQEYIKDYLNDSNSAEFEPTYNAAITHVDGNEYAVFYPLRARNGFNALRKATFVCHMRLNGENWESLYVKEFK